MALEGIQANGSWEMRCEGTPFLTTRVAVLSCKGHPKFADTGGRPRIDLFAPPICEHSSSTLPRSPTEFKFQG